MSMYQKLRKILFSFFIFLNLISFTGGLVYYFYSLNWLGVILSLILSIVFYFALINFYQKNKTIHSAYEQKTAVISKLTRKDIIFFILYIIIWLISFLILYNSRTNLSIISPWQVVPKYFFLLYFILSALLTLLCRTKFRLITAILHSLLTYSLALVIYQIGYGFDPFIHQATLELIDKTGVVTPKPIYYLGQYALIIIAHKLTFIPIKWLNFSLVPILASVYIPLFFEKLNQKFFNKKFGLWPLFLLVIPLPFVILSTPQNLAYLLLLICVIYSLSINSQYSDLILALFALSACVSQPIAGLPALSLVIWRLIRNLKNKKIKPLLFWLVFIFSVITLPLLFFMIEKNSGSQYQFQPFAIFDLFLSSSPTWPTQENFSLNFIYLYFFNIRLVIIGLIISGILLYRQKIKQLELSTYLFLGLAFFISYLISSMLAFGYLIEYERSNYSDRILIDALILLSPFMIIAFQNIYLAMMRQARLVQISLLLFLISLGTISLYLAYPRFDNYFNSRGYSVGADDIEAVQYIDKNANNEPYIVLANQQVSVAALKEFGFNHYYHNNVFYYPIPTGAPLYRYYLKMVYEKPSQETMSEAMRLAGVDLGYFVLNKYWWAFPKILDEAKLEFRNWAIIDQGSLYIFKYQNK